MEKICKKACMDKIPYFSTVSVDEDEVFELEATSWNGKKIVFDQFDGFVTAVINLPLVCDGSETEVIQDFHKLTRILPSSLQYLIFPFVSEETSCDNMAFAKQIINGHKNIHVTKPTKVNGEDTRVSNLESSPYYRWDNSVTDPDGETTQAFSKDFVASIEYHSNVDGWI